MDYIQKSHAILDSISKSEMPLVIVESPFAGKTIEEQVLNKKYARLCIRDCLKYNEAAYASHLIYTQEGILDDNVPSERALGIQAGLLWGAKAQKTIVYTDLGISSGMQKGIDRAISEGRTIEHRSLGYIPSVSIAEIKLEEMRKEVEVYLKQEAILETPQVSFELGL